MGVQVGILAASPQHSTSHTPLPSPRPQGWLLSLLDDNTLHLWEVCQKEGCSHLEETRSFGLPGRPGSGSAKYLPGGVGAAPPRGCGQRDAAASWEWRVGGMLAKLLSLMVFSPLGCSSDPDMLSAGNSSGVFMVLAGLGVINGSAVSTEAVLVLLNSGRWE